MFAKYRHLTITAAIAAGLVIPTMSMAATATNPTLKVLVQQDDDHSPTEIKSHFPNLTQIQIRIEGNSQANMSSTLSFAESIEDTYGKSNITLGFLPNVYYDKSDISNSAFAGWGCADYKPGQITPAYQCVMKSSMAAMETLNNELVKAGYQPFKIYSVELENSVFSVTKTNLGVLDVIKQALADVVVNGQPAKLGYVGNFKYASYMLTSNSVDYAYLEAYDLYKKSNTASALSNAITGQQADELNAAPLQIVDGNTSSSLCSSYGTTGCIPNQGNAYQAHYTTWANSAGFKNVAMIDAYVLGSDTSALKSNPELNTKIFWLLSYAKDDNHGSLGNADNGQPVPVNSAKALIAQINQNLSQYFNGLTLQNWGVWHPDSLWS